MCLTGFLFTIWKPDHVRHLAVTPTKATYNVGDEIRCSASGNPTPQISLKPASPQEKSGLGWKSVVVQKAWEGQAATIYCSASNTVNGRTETVYKNVSFTVPAGKSGSSTFDPRYRSDPVYVERSTSRLLNWPGSTVIVTVSEKWTELVVVVVGWGGHEFGRSQFGNGQFLYCYFMIWQNCSKGQHHYLTAPKKK